MKRFFLAMTVTMLAYMLTSGLQEAQYLAEKKAYEQGVLDTMQRIAAVPTPPPKPKESISDEDALKWWTDTTDMKAVKQKLCYNH